MTYLLYSTLGGNGEQVRRLGKYADLNDLDKELSRFAELGVNIKLGTEVDGKRFVIILGDETPTESAAPSVAAPERCDDTLRARLSC